VCHNCPYALREVLYAWEHGALTADSVKVRVLIYMSTDQLGVRTILLNVGTFHTFHDYFQLFQSS